MRKIAVFTGAGVSAESGVATFRNSKDGLWYNYNVDEVATTEALVSDPKKVYEFHNMLRSKLNEVEPNEAHKALAKLEDKFEVTISTQNVDDLHERGGSTNVLHIHGELFKARSMAHDGLLYECRGDLNVGDMSEDGHALRPHTVLFGEYPYYMNETFDAFQKADILIIIGTSLNISYTTSMVRWLKEGSQIYYIDPKPSPDLSYYNLPVKYIKKKAVEGVTKLVNKLLKDEPDSI